MFFEMMYNHKNKERYSVHLNSQLNMAPFFILLDATYDFPHLCSRIEKEVETFVCRSPFRHILKFKIFYNSFRSIKKNIKISIFLNCLYLAILFGTLLHF